MPTWSPTVRLGQQAKDVLSALDAGGDSPAIDEAITRLSRQRAKAPAPSAETLHLAQADEEELDAELLAIFIEEAKEVLEAIGSNLGPARPAPQCRDTDQHPPFLPHAPRAPAAWSACASWARFWGIEQVLNLWLRQELELTPAIFELIAQGHAVFSAWTEHLENRTMPLPDATALVALAESLRIGGGGTRRNALEKHRNPDRGATHPGTGRRDDTYDGAAAMMVLGTLARTRPPSNRLRIP